MHSRLLAPVVALVLWTLIMSAWLYATRIPVIVRRKIVYDPNRPAEEFHTKLPAEVRWKALFYAVAVALTLAWLGTDGILNTGLAWTYVGLRVAHSIVQATINVVMLRLWSSSPRRLFLRS